MQKPELNSGPPVDYEDQDGDVVMADEEVEQLISSLQAARHDSSGWDAAADHATISMLLFGHQVQACAASPTLDRRSYQYL